MNPAPHDLILIKGAPGVGKSTAAKLLAGHFASGVRIEVDTLRGMVIGVKWTDQAEHRSLLKLSAQLAAGFLRSGFAPVILIDTFSGDKVEHFMAAFRLEAPQSRVFVAVLHASGDVLRQRMLGREGEAFRDLAIATQINHEAVEGARPFDSLIDTSDLSPTDVARAMLAAMQEGTRLGGGVLETVLAEREMSLCPASERSSSASNKS